MSHPRISLALQADAFRLPPSGGVAVFGPATDISDLGADVVVQSRLATDHAYWQARNVPVVLALAARPQLSVVFLPRAKALARGLVAQAVAETDGPVVVDGQKTDGIDSLLKDLRGKADVGQVISKAHGKLFVISAAPDALAAWQLPAAPQQVADGFVTLPGVFSADGIDPASHLLAQGLPADLGRHVADLGAGWGYLSAQVLGRDKIETLHLVEVDHSALECARHNVPDPRAQFHWADATAWRPKKALDCVVMNPPFHTTRSADPDLGRAFIAAAAAALAPQGRLFMVANRHLPYEPALAQHFGQVTEFGGDARFKLLLGERPARLRR